MEKEQVLSRVTNFCVIFPIFPEYFDQGYKNISASGPLAGTRYRFLVARPGSSAPPSGAGAE